VPDDERVFRLRDDRPARRPRYVPPPGFDLHADEPDESPRRSFPGSFDPFFILLGIAAVFWLGLGLATARWAWMGLVLAAVGLLVCLVSKLYLSLLIFQEDREAGIWSLVSKWYQVWYLHQNVELTVRPMIVGVVGLLMIATGVLLFLARAKVGGG
jgi:hypothetical protein